MSNLCQGDQDYLITALKDLGLDHIKVKFCHDESETNLMVATCSENVICVNSLAVEKEYRENSFDCSLEDYFLVCLYHELGHFYDIEFDYDKEVSKRKEEFDRIIDFDTDLETKCNIITDIIFISIRKEVAAWILGRQFVQGSNLEGVYEKSNSINIQNYFTNLNSALRLLLTSSNIVSDELFDRAKEQAMGRIKSIIIKYDMPVGSKK